MIQKLKLKNFRAFSEKEFFFNENLNLIIGNNGKGKTNILEAISLLCNNPLQEISYESLVKSGEENMFISGTFSNNLVSISFEKQPSPQPSTTSQLQDSRYKGVEQKKIIGKKKFLVNSKSILKKNINKYSSKTIIFSPITMNLFYFSPSLRRKFLDEIIEKSFPQYKDYLKKYENILKNRNKLLKKIRENKNSQDLNNLDFWNNEFIKLAIIIYKFKRNLINFIKKDITFFEKYFDSKNVNVEFFYDSKINIEKPSSQPSPLVTKEEENIRKQFENHFKKNLDLEMILARTTIGPHLDDFDIKINGYKIIEYASRGEIKSIILALKFLEIDYLEKNTKEIPIILIDDFLSEIDIKHKSLLLAKIKGYQTIITSIFDIEIYEENKVNKIFLK